MPRPSVDGWFDSRVRIWRPLTLQGTLGEEKRRYNLVATVGAAINRSRSPVAPASAGLAPTGILRLYFRPDTDVEPRDVLEVISGPDAGSLRSRTWEVNEYPVHPRGHHTQVDCIEWHGTLQES